MQRLGGTQTTTGEPSSPFTRTLPFGPDPLLHALAFLVSGEANKLKGWNKLGPSGKFDRQSVKEQIKIEKIAP